MDETVSHYRLEERLGAGGMGVVYRALDTRLGRTVALKFLPEGLAANPEIRERFVQEARATSSLDHPNICTIFDIGETDDGRMFIVMAYYAGEPLNHLIANGPLDVERAIGIAIQAGKGLAAAHDALIIHRDVKPGNIMITERETVKILDFGLAKLASLPRLTKPDSAIGTPGYMAPEQIQGGAVDARADIWALAVVLFEMVTGRLPFKGDRIESMIHSVLHEPASRVSMVRSGLPPGLDQVLSRALSKSPRSRHERMSEFIGDLQDLFADVNADAMTVQRPARKSHRSIAVLPFVNMSSDPDQEYFCDGIAEELLGALSAVPDLHVASRTSAFQFKGNAIDVREIGQKLNVSTVLEGSVRKAGHRVRVSAQLVSVDDGYRLWHERYDRDMEDIFAIQDEIAHAIAEALQVTLGEERSRPAEKPTSKDIEAYDFYLRGRQYFHQHRRKGFEMARQMFLRAIEIDPNYARAYAGIADCGSLLCLYFGHPEEADNDVENASRKAVELDPDLAEAHVSRGMALAVRKDYEEAERELETALRLNGELFEAHYSYARICWAQGKLDEAARHFEKACRISPDSYDSWLLLASVYNALGDQSRGRAATIEGFEATRRWLNQSPDDTRAWTFGASALAELGEPEKAVEWIRRALALDPDEPMVLYNAGCSYVLLGMPDDALDCLEKAVRHGSIWKEWMENDPDLDPIRDLPRFQALVGQLH